MRIYLVILVAAVVLAGCGGGGGGGGGNSGGGSPVTLIGSRAVPGMVVALHTTSVVDTYRVQVTGILPTSVEAWLAIDPITGSTPVAASPQTDQPENWSVTLPRSALPNATCVWVRVVDADGNICEVGQNFLIGP